MMTDTQYTEMNRREAAILTKFHQQLEDVNPLMARHFRETFNDPGNTVGLIHWMDDLGTHRHPYEAFQRTAQDLDEGDADTLAQLVARHMTKQDLRICKQIARNPEQTANRMRNPSQDSNHYREFVERIQKAAMATTDSVQITEREIASALAKDDRERYNETIRRTSSAQARLSIAMTTPGRRPAE